jgi:hypothetical protein
MNRPPFLTAQRMCCIALLGFVLAGCESPRLQPWQKRNLARPEMLMSGDALQERFDQHIYTSRENASGGYGVGGGGCGCN